MQLDEVYDDRYRKGYRERLSGYEIARYRALEHFIPPLLRDTTPPLKVLDYGSGSGLYIELQRALFPGSDLYFCDISSVALEKLGETYPEYRSQCAPVSENRAQFDADSFDVVLSIEVMEHVEDLHAYLRDIRRLLKEGGVFLWTTPCGNPFSIEHIFSYLTGQIEPTGEGFRRWKWEDPTHVRRLQSGEIADILTRSGFHHPEIKFRSHFFSFFCTYLFRIPWPGIRERLMCLDYALFRNFENGASMIGAARKASLP